MINRILFFFQWKVNRLRNRETHVGYNLCVSKVGFYAYRLIFGKWLLDKSGFLAEFLLLPHHDFVVHGFRFPLLFQLLAPNLLLLFHGFGGYLLGMNDRRRHGGSVHRDISGLYLIAALQRDDNADFIVAVDIGAYGGAFDHSHICERYILSQCIYKRRNDGFRVRLRSIGSLRKSNFREFFARILEIIAAGYE